MDRSSYVKLSLLYSFALFPDLLVPLRLLITENIKFCYTDVLSWTSGTAKSVWVFHTIFCVVGLRDER